MDSHTFVNLKNVDFGARLRPHNTLCWVNSNTTSPKMGWIHTANSQELWLAPQKQGILGFRQLFDSVSKTKNRPPPNKKYPKARNFGISPV